MTKHIKLKKNKADLMNTFLTIQPPYFKSSPLKMLKICAVYLQEKMKT